MRLLERGGHRVIHAVTGREALAIFPLVVPGVIVLDMLMPEMDGLTFLKVLRGYYRGSSLPVIVLTAAWDAHLTDRVLALGVKKVFRKSDYRLSDLLSCVNELTPGAAAEFAKRVQQHPSPFPDPAEPVPEPIPQPMPEPIPQPPPEPAPRLQTESGA